MNPSYIYRAKLHWIIFFWPVVFLIATLALLYALPDLWQLTTLFTLFGFLWIGMTYITYHFSSLTITKKQLIVCTGILVRQTVDIQLTKIESIDIRQPIIGSILRYGSLIITGTGGTKQEIHFLSNPLTCRRTIEQLVQEIG